MATIGRSSLSVSPHATIQLFAACGRTRTAPAQLPAAGQRPCDTDCNGFGGTGISLDVSLAVLGGGVPLDRRHLPAGRTRCSLAAAVVGVCFREDQVSRVRCAVYRAVPSVGSEDLPALCV